AKAIVFESVGKRPCQCNHVRSEAGSDLVRRAGQTRGSELAMTINCGATFPVAIRAPKITWPPRLRQPVLRKVVHSAERPSPRRNSAPSRAPSVFPTISDREKFRAHA